MAASKEITVLTYNIRYDNPSDGEDRWEFRKAGVVSLLAHNKPDFFGLQEALSHQLHYIGENLKEIYNFVGVGRSDGNQGGEFNPLFWNREKFNLLDSGTFWLTHEPSQPSKLPSASLPRICTWGKFNKRNNEKAIFLIFNTHFSYESDTIRVEEATILSRQIQNIAQLYPSILIGDFNATESDRSYRLIANSFFTDSKTLVSAANRINDQYQSFTGFHGPVKDALPMGSVNIDWLFVSGFEVSRWEQIMDTLPGGRALSDHRAISITAINKYE